jgi:monoamine oxidase
LLAAEQSLTERIEVTLKQWCDQRLEREKLSSLAQALPDSARLTNSRVASYYFPGRGEVTTWGPFWKAGYDDWFHFAGEHTCYAFMGYTEGALLSGYRLARKLAVRDKIFPT